MDIIKQIINKVKENPQKIVFPEYKEERMYEAAKKLLEQELVKEIIFIGEPEYITKKLQDYNIKCQVLSINEYNEEFAKEYYKLRREKGKDITEEEAIETMKNELYAGAMVVRKGMADGMVAGAMNTTADVVRAAIRVIGTREGIRTVSSFFMMATQNKEAGIDGLLFFADCGVVINPTVNQLADIGIVTADSFKKLTGETPIVAFLSFSTYGSAKHVFVDKIKKAVEEAKKKAPDLILDGELQGDAALSPRVAQKKCPDSPVKGRANVLIFPDLNSGNIAYKLVQYLGNANAYGPILQGLAKPVNDLSRGCTSDDIVTVACITQVMAMKTT